MWVANCVASFLAKDTSSLPVAYLSSLTNQVTLTVSLTGPWETLLWLGEVFCSVLAVAG